MEIDIPTATYAISVSGPNKSTRSAQGEYSESHRFCSTGSLKETLVMEADMLVAASGELAKKQQTQLEGICLESFGDCQQNTAQIEKFLVNVVVVQRIFSNFKLRKRTDSIDGERLIKVRIVDIQFFHGMKGEYIGLCTCVVLLGLPM